MRRNLQDLQDLQEKLDQAFSLCPYSLSLLLPPGAFVRVGDRDGERS